MKPADASVFIIDDDPSVRKGLSRLLRSAGYAVQECGSAVEFLDRPAPAGTSCAILDVRMPQMTGPELFHRMVQSGLSMPVIFLTGHGDVPTSVRAMKLGAVDFLLKPVDGDTLLQAVKTALRRHAALRGLESEKAEVQQRLSTLSRREREVMSHVIRGSPNKIIAHKLGISEKTVKVHRHRVMEKTGAGSVAELVRLADADGSFRGEDPGPGSP